MLITPFLSWVRLILLFYQFRYPLNSSFKLEGKRQPKQNNAHLIIACAPFPKSIPKSTRSRVYVYLISSHRPTT